MNYGDFVHFVKERSTFKSDEAVRKAVESVLKVLGEKISIGQAVDIAAALPAELKPYLMQTPEAEKFNLEDFLRIVGQEEGVDTRTAEEHARAVLTVLGEWIPRAELRDTLAQMPSDMRNLFYSWEKEVA